MFCTKWFIFVSILLSGLHCSSLNRFTREISRLLAKREDSAGAYDESCQQSGFHCDCSDLSILYFCMTTEQGLEKLEVRKCQDGLECVEAVRGCTTLKNTKCASDVCRGDDFYPDDEDCLFYFDCRTGAPKRTQCPTGQSFSKAESACVDGMDGCDDVETTTASTTAPPPACDGRFMVDPTSCLHYYDCLTDPPTRRKCPKHMSFSPIYMTCVHGYFGCL